MAHLSTGSRAHRRSLGTIHLTLTLLATLAFGACEESPDAGFERFYEAIAAGDVDSAVHRLTREARTRLGDANATRGLTAQAALAAAMPTTTVRQVRVLEVDGNAAVVEVTDALGASTQVPMRREDGRWCVDFGGARP